MHTKRRVQLFRNIFKATSYLINDDFSFLFTSDFKEVDIIESMKALKLVRDRDDYIALKVSTVLKPENIF